jgi:hypothetical protein
LRAASRAFAARIAFSRDAGRLLEERAELVAEDRLDDALHLARHELRLRLRVERRVAHLDADDRREPLADVLTREARLHVAEEVLRVAVVVEHARERSAEAGDVRPAVFVVDVVRVREDLLAVARVPLERDLDGDRRARLAGLLREDVHDLVVDRFLRFVQVLDELADAALVLEELVARRATMVGLALVGQRDDEARVQER